MAVRFLPPPEERIPANRDEGENLAEVVEMRSWLRPASTDGDGDVEAELPEPAGWASDAEPAASGWASGAEPTGAPWVSADESWTGDAGDGNAPTEGPGESGGARVTRVQFGNGPVETAAESARSTPSETAPANPRRKRESAKTARRADRGASAQVPAEAPAGAESDDESSRSEAYEDAVRLLARRARSSGELRDDLLALDHSADEVLTVIDEFIESRYLDDIGLARVQSEKLRDSKGASRGQIARKLRERKLPDAVVEEILGELDVDEEFSLLREAAAKRAERLTGLDRQTAQRRLLGFLARRGWSGEPAMRAANEALDGGLGRGKRGPGGVRFE